MDTSRKHFHTYAQITLRKREQKDFKSWKNRELAVETVSPRNVKSYTHEISPSCLPKHEINKAGTVAMLKWMEDSPGSLSLHKN